MKIKCPLFAKSISAGFPSPANDYIEKKLDLNEHLIKSIFYILYACKWKFNERCFYL